nr:MAG TPA: hypothetical protein [Caudoviricetes sp.]
MYHIVAFSGLQPAPEIVTTKGRFFADTISIRDPIVAHNPISFSFQFISLPGHIFILKIIPYLLRLNLIAINIIA